MNYSNLCTLEGLHRELGGYCAITDGVGTVTVIYEDPLHQTKIEKAKRECIPAGVSVTFLRIEDVVCELKVLRPAYAKCVSENVELGMKLTTFRILSGMLAVAFLAALAWGFYA